MSVKNDNKYNIRDKYGCITSQNNAYKIHTNEQLNSDEPGIIYAKKGIPIQYSFLELSPTHSSPKGYDCYRYTGIWNRKSNDCLDFAESLANNKAGASSDECTFIEPITNKLFGDNDNSNANIVRKLKEYNMRSIDSYANPDVGEAYAFVLDHDFNNGFPLPDIVPFHIAYVVFKDGNTNITLEANSGAKLKNPMFDMYDTRKGSANTFHKITKDIYTAGYIERKYESTEKYYLTQTDYNNQYMNKYTTIVLHKK